ncbi:TetR/AcrR family transcriptional regulator [Streptomyces sp. NPDC006692]|uniref:TetR/AcrR family transcriptional regulator n=1 Tax=unclassified Streptomyces TaxID=2593676 RepID=UPI0036D205A1
MTTDTDGHASQFYRATVVLEAARLFWQRGYSGTSTRELSAALKLSTTSIYAAFGSKAGLFEEAVRTYADRYRVIYQDACAQPDFSDTLAQLFRRSVEEFTQPNSGHPGCLVSSAAMMDGPDTIDTRAYLDDLYASNQRLLHKRIDQAQNDGQVPKGTDPATLAASLQTVWHGLSVQSNQGLGRNDLLRLADLVVSAQPGGRASTTS